MGPGTRKMAERMRQLARADAVDHPYMSQKLVEQIRKFLEGKHTTRQEANARMELATQLLNSGQTAAAIQALQDVETFLTNKNMKIGAESRARLMMQRGLCYLRLGEQQNCVFNHTAESCLFPITPAGVHRLPQGSREAIGLFTEVLKQNPDYIAAAWLLNIAYMTLGEYPDKVPKEWLFPPSVFASEYDIKRFPNVAPALGVDIDDVAGGSIIEDFDGDGYLDIMASCWRVDGPLRFFRNDGKGNFIDQTTNAGLAWVTGGLNIQQTDYNNDGHPDVFMLRGGWLGKGGHHPDSLLRNNGDGTFEDVTEEAGLLSFHPSQAATWFDFDNDGWLDVFIANESVPNDRNPCQLFRNNRDGTFTECAAESGVALTAFYKGVSSGDYDNDGDPDLFISDRNGANRLIRNDGPAAAGSKAWRFTDVTAKAGITNTYASFPTWFFDYDNDGWVDIFVAGYSITGVGEIAADYLDLPHEGERARLYHNNGDGTFTDVTRKAGLYKVLHAMGSNFGDLDNDGWLDFYVGTGDPHLSTIIPNRMFRNAEGARFQEVTTSGGFGHLQKGHGAAFGDIDHDGDEDIYAVIGGAFTGDNYRNALFLNPGHSNNWIGLKLVGAKSNRAAIGARIKVVVQAESQMRNIYKTVNSGGSFGSSPLRQHIGLGRASAIQQVEILWPGAKGSQQVRGLEINRLYVIHENQPVARRIDLNPIKLQFKPNMEPWCGPTNVATAGVSATR